jgi:hypothetical protein
MSYIVVILLYLAPQIVTILLLVSFLSRYYAEIYFMYMYGDCTSVCKGKVHIIVAECFNYLENYEIICDYG